MRPRPPDCDQLVDLRPWRPGLWKGTWGPDRRPVLVKRWAVPSGADATRRLQWQEAAVEALGEATPAVLWRELESSKDPTDAPRSHLVSVIEWAEGAPPRLPLSRALLHQLLEALERLHAAGLVHRDICARNLLVTPAGRLQVLDLDEVVPPGEEADVVGTIGHMPPEVSAGGRPSIAADLYAIGPMLDVPMARELAALAHAPHPAHRAARARELMRMLPLPLHGSSGRHELTGPSTLHCVPEQIAALSDTLAGRTARQQLDGVGWGRLDDQSRKQLSPDDLLRWRALAQGPQTLPALREQIAAGSPGLALWSMVDHPAAWNNEQVDTFGTAAMETYEAAAQRRALVVLHRCDDPAAGFWVTLLSELLKLQHGEARAVYAKLSTLRPPERSWARRAWEIGLFRAALGVSPQQAQATLDRLADSPTAGDDDHACRRRSWSGLLDYRRGQYESARDQLEEVWRRRRFAHARAMTASNLLAILLHLDAPTRAEAVAREALAQLPPGAHPIAAARLATKMREAIYRGHPAPTPDTDLLEAMLPGLPPVSAALAVLNEAAAAWRGQRPSLAAQLAHDSARRFEASRFLPGALLAGALAFRTGHPSWETEADRLEASVDRLLDRRRGSWLPAIAAQVLGLLASGPSDPRAEDAASLAAEVDRPPEARREVLSLTECGQGGLS